MSEKKDFQVSCPQCRKKFSYYSCKFRPFCSERCKMIDLGLWLSESYALPSRENLDESDIDQIEKSLENPEEGENS